MMMITYTMYSAVSLQDDKFSLIYAHQEPHSSGILWNMIHVHVDNLTKTLVSWLLKVFSDNVQLSILQDIHISCGETAAHNRYGWDVLHSTQEILPFPDILNTSVTWIRSVVPGFGSVDIVKRCYLWAWTIIFHVR